MEPRHRPRPARPAHRAALTAVVLACGLAACTGGTAAPAPPSPSASPTTSSAAPVTTSTRTAPTNTAPTQAPSPADSLTGFSGGPVLAVKIDNTRPARPRFNTDQADIVYVEPVEAGLTRLLAIYSTRQPDRIGPVRSARESDAQILGNYGRVAFAFSGGSSGTLAQVRTGPQINLSYDQSGQGFRRDGSRPAPYNVVGFPAQLLARAGGSAPAGDIGFRYGPALSGAPAGEVTASTGGWTGTFTWDPATRRYLITTDGQPEVTAEGNRVSAATVVVQIVRTYPGTNSDVNGERTPVIVVTGTGPAYVLRDGMQAAGQWSRPSAGAPTTFTTGDGRVIPFAPGPVWVLLVPQGRPVSIR